MQIDSKDQIDSRSRHDYNFSSMNSILFGELNHLNPKS